MDDKIERICRNNECRATGESFVDFLSVKCLSDSDGNFKDTLYSHTKEKTTEEDGIISKRTEIFLGTDLKKMCESRVCNVALPKNDLHLV